MLLGALRSQESLTRRPGLRGRGATYWGTAQPSRPYL